MHWAANDNRVEAMQFLVTHGADPNIKTNVSENSGGSVVHIACSDVGCGVWVGVGLWLCRTGRHFDCLL